MYNLKCKPACMFRYHLHFRSTNVDQDDHRTQEGNSEPQKPEIDTAVFLQQYFIRQLFTLKTCPDICLIKCPKIILLPLCYPKKKLE